MISCLGAPTRHLLMPRDPFQLSSVVTSQYSKIFFLEKVSGKSPESCPESLPIWVNSMSHIIWRLYLLYIHDWLHMNHCNYDVMITWWSLYYIIITPSLRNKLNYSYESSYVIKHFLIRFHDSNESFRLLCKHYVIITQYVKRFFFDIILFFSNNVKITELEVIM